MQIDMMQLHESTGELYQVQPLKTKRKSSKVKQQTDTLENFGSRVRFILLLFLKKTRLVLKRAQSFILCKFLGQKWHHFAARIALLV